MFKVFKRHHYQEKVYKLSLWEIWKKIHITNEYSDIDESSLLWKVSTRFKSLFRLCFVCYTIAIIAIYTLFIIDFTIEPSGNIFLIFLNLIIMILPWILVELGLTFFVPIQIKEKGK